MADDTSAPTRPAIDKDALKAKYRAERDKREGKAHAKKQPPFEGWKDWHAMLRTERKRPIADVANVATSGATPLTTSEPLKSPAANPASTPPDSAAAIGQPASRSSAADTTDENTVTEPTERSMPPVKTMGVKARARTAGAKNCWLSWSQ